MCVPTKNVIMFGLRFYAFYMQVLFIKSQLHLFNVCSYISLAVLAREQGGAEVSTEGMDDCGLRYMLAARHHVYLLNTLTFVQRAQLQKNGLNPSVLIWAFHSESEEVRPSVNDTQ